MSVLVSCYEEMQQGMGQVLMLTISMIPNKLEEFKKQCSVFCLKDACIKSKNIKILKILCRLKITLQTCVVLLQIYLDEESATVFGRSFIGRPLTIVKNGICKYLNNKLVKQNYLTDLFSVLYHHVEAKTGSSPNSFLFLKFGNNTEFRLWSWLCWCLQLCGRKKPALLQERRLVCLHSKRRNAFNAGITPQKCIVTSLPSF